MTLLHRRLRTGAAGFAAAALTASASSAWADPAPSYADLLARIGNAPVVAEAAARLDAAEGRARQAAARPNPMLSVEAENAFGSGPFSGYDNADTTVSVSQDLELWGRRSARVEAAQAESDVVALRRDMTLVEAAGRLALTYAEAEAAQRRAALADDALVLALADARAVLTLVEEGREPMLRAIQAESESAAARAALDEARAEQRAAYARLTAAAQLPDPVTTISSSLLDLSPSVSEPRASAPEVLLAEAERRQAERRIDVERTRTRPDVSASIGVRRFEAEDASAFTFGLSMALPLFDRNRGNVEAAQAELRAADARLAGARLDAQADRSAAVARIEASASRVAAADAGVAAAEEAYRLTRIGFEAGRISLLELHLTRGALTGARTAAVDARLARARAEIDLARLDGRAPFQGAQ